MPTFLPRILEMDGINSIDIIALGNCGLADDDLPVVRELVSAVAAQAEQQVSVRLNCNAGIGADPLHQAGQEALLEMLADRNVAHVNVADTSFAAREDDDYSGLCNFYKRIPEELRDKFIFMDLEDFQDWHLDVEPHIIAAGLDPFRISMDHYRYLITMYKGCYLAVLRYDVEREDWYFRAGDTIHEMYMESWKDLMSIVTYTGGAPRLEWTIEEGTTLDTSAPDMKSKPPLIGHAMYIGRDGRGYMIDWEATDAIRWITKTKI